MNLVIHRVKPTKGGDLTNQFRGKRKGGDPGLVMA